MNAKSPRRDDASTRLHELQRKFTDGTATPREKVAWLTHLKAKAQQQHDEERVLALVQQLQTAEHEEFAAATQALPCPDGSPRVLTWIRTADVRPRRLPALHAPDADALTDLTASIKAQGVLQNLVLGPDHDVIIGEGRRQAARRARVPYVPALVLHEVSEAERELTALAADVFARPQLSLRRLTRYSAVYRAVLGQEFIDTEQSPVPEGTMAMVTDLMLAYHHLSPELQREVEDLIAEGNAARAAIQTAVHKKAARGVPTAPAEELHQRLTELDQRLAAVEGERNSLQDTNRQLDTQLSIIQGRLHTAEDDLVSVAEEASTHKQETTKLTRELHTLRERLAQLRPLEQLAATPQTLEVMGEGVQLVELVCGRLLRSLSTLLDVATATTSSRECKRVLDDIVEQATACKRALAKLGR